MCARVCVYNNRKRDCEQIENKSVERNERFKRSKNERDVYVMRESKTQLSLFLSLFDSSRQAGRQESRWINFHTHTHKSKHFARFSFIFFLLNYFLLVLLFPFFRPFAFALRNLKDKMCVCLGCCKKVKIKNHSSRMQQETRETERQSELTIKYFCQRITLHSKCIYTSHFFL